MKNLIAKIRLHLRALRPILLSHHPLCETFSNDMHTFKIGHRKLCIGCFITYPTALVFYLIGSLSGLFNIFTTPQLWYFGFGLCGIYLFSILGLTKTKKIKMITKFLIGCGIAFCVAAIWSLSHPIRLRLIVIGIYFLIGHAFINTMRLLDIYRTCHKCEYDCDWQRCPGMSSILSPDTIPKIESDTP
ncbi:hypothetical protein [Candidatus Lokiarchaeum ossiferum]